MEDGSNDIRVIEGKLGEVIYEATEVFISLISDSVGKAVEQEGVMQKVMMAVGGKKAEEAVSPYIGAVSLLAFSGKYVNRESVESIISSIGINPDTGIMNFVSLINLRNDAVFVPALFFMKALGKEPDADSMGKIVEAMGIKADKDGAGRVLGLYGEMRKEDYSTKKRLLDDKLAKPITDSAKLMAKIMIMELRRTFENRGIGQQMQKGLLPYVVGAGVMAYSGKGKEVNGESISTLIKVIGIEPDQSMLGYFSSLNYGTVDLAYVPIIFFLREAGRVVNIQNIRNVMRAMGAQIDEAFAEYILTIYFTNER